MEGNECPKEEMKQFNRFSEKKSPSSRNEKGVAQMSRWGMNFQ
ncbi:hypothetical protein ACFQDF_09095 [Ectobacillus funiculus]